MKSKTFARLTLGKRVMSVLILSETDSYFECQVVKDVIWSTNDVVKVSKSLVVNITDKI